MATPSMVGLVVVVVPTGVRHQVIPIRPTGAPLTHAISADGPVAQAGGNLKSVGG